MILISNIFKIVPKTHTDAEEMHGGLNQKSSGQESSHKGRRKMNRINNELNHLVQFVAEKHLEEVLNEVLKEVVTLENDPQHANASPEGTSLRQTLVADRQQSIGFDSLRAGVLQQQLLKAGAVKTAKAPVMQTRGLTIQTNDKTETTGKKKSGGVLDFALEQAGLPDPRKDPAGFNRRLESIGREKARKEIDGIMNGYDPTSSDADEKAEAVSKRKDLLPHLTKDERENLVRGLFDGPTGEDEEDAAMEILRTASDEDLKKIVDSIGWDKLRDELDEEDIKEITKRLANAKPTRANSPSTKVIEDKGGVSDTKGKMEKIQEQIKAKLDSMTPAQIEVTSKELLTDKNSEAILNEVARLGRSGNPNSTAIVTALIELVTQLENRTTDPKLKSKLAEFKHRIRYTSEISEKLAAGDYAGLQNILRDMARPSVPQEQRDAIYETLRDFAPQLQANVKAIQIYGDAKQRADASVFMSRYQSFMKVYHRGDSGGDFLDKLSAELGLAGQTAEDKYESLNKQLAQTSADLEKTIGNTLWKENDMDDAAESLTNGLNDEQLGALPTNTKVRMIKDMLDGHTGDDQEQAILRILRETKKNSPQEFFQIINEVGYENIAYSMTGSEYDEFQNLMAA